MTDHDLVRPDPIPAQSAPVEPKSDPVKPAPKKKSAK